MKTGKTLQELSAQIKRENQEKRDFVTPTTRLEYGPGDGPLGTMRFDAGGESYEMRPTRHCLRQIGDYTGIPAKYLDRMIDGNRDLLAHNINHWFQKEPSKRMLRTLINGEQTARAFLSDRYRPLDNAQLAEAVLPTIAESGCEVLSAEITETRLYIQVATPRIQLDLVKLMRERGIEHSHAARPLTTDIVQAGAVISNSEVGSGSLRVEQMIWRLECYNGLIMPTSMRRNHVGRRNDIFAELEEASQFYSDTTREMEDKVLFAKVRDVVRGVFNTEGFASIAEKFAGASAIELPGATEAVEIVTDRLRLSEGESKSVLDHLAEGGDLSLFGLANAVTRTAEDSPSYDRAVELERMGGQVLELPTQIWGKN